MLVVDLVYADGGDTERSRDFVAEHAGAGGALSSVY